MAVWTVLFVISVKIENIYLIYAVVFSFFTVMFCGVKFLPLNFFVKSVCKVKPSPKDTIFLSFDDGPNQNITPKILELLDKYNQKASFFVIAQKAKKYPEIVKKIVENGHTLGSHDLYHRLTDNFRRTGQMFMEIGESVKILEEISNTKVNFYRPPVGLSNPHLFFALKKLNLQCTGWSKSVGDAKNRIVSAIKKIPNLYSAKDGDIILLHDDCPVKNEVLFLQNLEELLKNFEKTGKKSARI
jgi:peptidoglycan/xylan/chitin deacetylase (PgdA/CDA1 family)